MDRASCEPQRLAQSLPRQVLPAGKDIRADCRCLRMAHRSQDVLILSCASAMTRAERHASPHESGLPGELATHRGRRATPHENGQTRKIRGEVAAGPRKAGGKLAQREGGLRDDFGAGLPGG